MSLLASLALGGLAGWGLYLALGPHHPLAPTAALVVAAGAAMRHFASRLGVRVGPRLPLAAAAVLATAIATPALAVQGLDRLVMVAILALLVGCVRVLVPGLRRRLGSERSALLRPDSAFFWIPLVCYVILIPWTAAQRPPDGDEPYYLLIAHSIVDDLDVDLTDNYADGDSLHFMPRRLEPQLGDPKGRDGHWFSRHDLLFPAFAAIPYALGGKLAVLALMAGITSLLGWWTLRLARHRPGPTGGLFRAWLLLMFVSPLVVYSHQVWIEVPAALLVVMALDGILEINGRWPSRRLAWRILVPILVLVPLKLRLALLAGPLALLLWWRSGRSWRLGLLVGLPLAALSAALLAFNTWFFGRALKVYELGDLGLLQPPLLRYLRHFIGLFFDLSFGLFALAPVWLLLIPATAAALRRREPVLAHLAVVVGPYFFLLLSRREWYGGWSPAFRYGLVMLPLLALVLAPALDRARGAGWRVLSAAGLLLSGGTLGAAVVVPGWTFNFADGSSRLADIAMMRFGVDVVRFLPSGIRDRPSTWWVPLALAAIVLLVTRWRGRAGHRALAAPLGWGVALLLPLLLVCAGATVPTHVIEAEDRWVQHDQGAPYPGLWTPDRARFRGGWAVPAGGALRAPIVDGGAMVEVTAWLRPGFNTEAELHLELCADETCFETLVVPRTSADTWGAFRFAATPWPEEADLVLRLPRTDHRRLRNFVVVDRIELTWR